METAIRCFSCMRPVEAKDALCPHCGYDNSVRTNGPGMLTETVLNQQYRVGRVLGRGGFGITYIGYDESLDRTVAIKEYFPSHLVSRDGVSQTLSVISDSVENFEKGRAKVLRESRLAAGLGQIPGVVQVYNVISANNTIYIIMEYIDGCTLTDYLKNADRPLDFKEAVELLEPVAKALQRLHSQKVIHRDVKPDNIMIRHSDHESILLDFGSARVQDGTTMSRSAAVVSAGFSPIEQYSNYGLDGRLDEYALCATLYYALTGKPPKEALMRIAEGEGLESITAVNPTVTKAAQAVIFRGMAMNADHRYPTLDEMWKALLSSGDERMSVRKKYMALIAAVAALTGIFMFFGWLNTEDVHNYESEIRRFQQSVDSGYEGHIEPLAQEIEALFAAVEGENAAEEMFQLANLYRDGVGVEQNLKKAAEYYRMAAEQGHAPAMAALASCFENGRGVKQNNTRAVEWYQKALDGGEKEIQEDLARVMNLIGVSYHEGSGVKRDYEKAVEWFQKAADLGNSDAMNNLGKCYYYGRGVEQNIELANEWYDKALK